MAIETFDEIMERMLARVPNIMDKREGSIIWDALAPCALEVVGLEAELESYVKNSYADTADREFLIRMAKERGLEPYPASYAVWRLVTTPASLEVGIGSRFNLNELNYVVTEKEANGSYFVRCESLGSVGNNYSGICVPIDYIEGLETCTITDLLVPARDEEETESFRVRYINSFLSLAYGGNVEDYKQKTLALDGVGGVKVYPVWNGAGTVKLSILNANFGKPSTALVEDVQEAIDPTQDGTGVGIAPIGHRVTVVGVEEQTVNIAMTLQYVDSTWNWNEVREAVETAIDEYFLELGRGWMESAETVVRWAQLEAKLLTVTGVLDVTSLTIDGQSANLVLGVDKIPVRGSVSGS